MPFGRRFRSRRAGPSGPDSGTAPERVAGIASAIVLAVALGGCASGNVAPERAAERRAALDRWSRCVERQSDTAALSDVRARVERGCEGHRRDVLRAFPPRMAPQLERLMDERRDVALGTRLREEGGTRDAADPLLTRVLDAL